MTTALMSRENPIWTLPEEHNYAIEFFTSGKWMRREQYKPFSHLKAVLAQLNMHAEAVRIVKVSRYPPHPAQAVLYYRENPQ